MKKTNKLILGFLALLLSLQFNALAENSQGTITAIDSSGPDFNLLPNHGDTQAAEIVRVKPAPGAQYKGVDSFDGLQVGDYVEIDASSKSKTGSTLEATQIARRYPAVENVYYSEAMRITQTTVTTTTTMPVIVQTVPAPAATIHKKTEVVNDGNSTSTKTTTTTTY